jgi:hypothetical protein
VLKGNSNQGFVKQVNSDWCVAECWAEKLDHCRMARDGGVVGVVGVVGGGGV